MTTASLSPPIAAPAQPPAADPYRYGWRYVRREQPQGGAVYDQVPLTLEDVLYPQVGDFIVHSKAHEDICTYLADVCNAQLRDDPSAVVLHDVRVAWDVPELRPNGPDITVILGVREQQNWSTFDVAQEGVRPALIIEVTSPETRQTDLVDKVDIYEQASVPLYVIIDTRRWQGSDRLHLIAYHLTPTGYELHMPNERGWLWLAPARLWLALEDNRVHCYDAQHNLIGDYVAIEVARREAEARAQAEASARHAAEQRIHELEAELQRLRQS